MCEANQSIGELIRVVQGVKPDQKEALEELVAQLYIRLRAFAKKRLFRGTSPIVDASDVVMMAVKSLLSDIVHGRLPDPVLCWEALLVQYIKNKVRSVNRPAGRPHNQKATDNAALQSMPNPEPAVSCENVERAFQGIGNILPARDGTAAVFRQVVLNGLTHQKAAEVLGLSQRTIGNKMQSVANHMVDLLIKETNLDPVIEEAVRLVLDPRTCVDAEEQAPGCRLSEFERRIRAAAREKGIEAEEMERRVKKALQTLAGVLHEHTT